MAIFSRKIIGRFSQVDEKTAMSAEAYKAGMSACGTSTGTPQRNRPDRNDAWRTEDEPALLWTWQAPRG
jgi:hypothetical protein